MPRLPGHLPRRLFLLATSAGAALIAAQSLAYFDLDVLPPFAVERLPVRFEALWLVALRVHVAAALVTLPLCLALSTRTLQRRAGVHRWLGRLAGVLVLAALVPSGAVLAFDAKGGPLVTAGFLASAAVVAISMVGGVVAARRRALGAHRRAMHHVVAQMSVAVSSRAMLMGFDAAGVDPDLAYVVALWVPVVASAAVAELASPGPHLATLHRHLERIRREASPLLLRVRARLGARSLVRVGR